MSSTAGDFRNMTPLALMAALKQAGVTVYEPMNHFELEIPQASLSTVMQSPVGVEARLTDAPMSSGEIIHLEGLLPARRTFEFERNVPDLTNGEGSFVAELGEYQAIHGSVPTRERTDNNPLNREEYLKRITDRG
jgi:ribosomal protection tetracycline resistance protein